MIAGAGLRQLVALNLKLFPGCSPMQPVSAAQFNKSKADNTAITVSPRDYQLSYQAALPPLSLPLSPCLSIYCSKNVNQLHRADLLRTMTKLPEPDTKRRRGADGFGETN